MAKTATLREARTADDIAAVRTLCWAYRDFLLGNSPLDREITHEFYPVARYETLMQGLETEHARPQGIILLAEQDAQPVGCGMTHALDADTSEIKRLFVQPQARGAGTAAHLCRALMDQARQDGFRRIVLDTSRTLTSAQRLYARLGFTQRGPYQPVPAKMLPHLIFYEATL